MSDYDRGWSDDRWGQQAAPPPGGASPGAAPPPGYVPQPGYPADGHPPGGYPSAGYPSAGYQQPYGPPPSPQRSRGGGCLRAFAIGAGAFFALLVLIAVVALAGGGSEDDEPETAGEQAATPAAEGGGQEVYAVGQTAHSGDLDVTVHTVQDPYQAQNPIVAPQPGHRWVAVEAELRNGTGELVTWSSLLGSELTDSQGRAWNITITGDNLPQLDGDVPIQGNRRGWVVFEVAQDASGLQIRIKGNPTATGSLFRLT